LITDIRILGMPGPELVRQVCQLCPEVRVMYVSGGGQPAETERYHSFLPKPYGPDALLESVQAVLAGVE
jgi:DNA-binding NarL/FixJ family response regulator